jgi:hypothetical protein
LNGARTHSRQGKAREHGDGVGFVCLSFLLSVQEFLRRKKGIPICRNFLILIMFMFIAIVMCEVTFCSWQWRWCILALALALNVLAIGIGG